MILLIDNYDSFTYNLYQYLGEMGQEILVKRNDQITLDEIKALAPSHIVLSPGPGRPENAGLLVEIVQAFYQTIPILGICLGHQAIGQALGGTVIHGPSQVHGKASPITHDGKGVFAGLAQNVLVGRYHSLIVSPDNLPERLDITSQTSDQVIMGIRHKNFPLEGIQFHPESLLSGDEGKQMLANFIKI
ncbi:MAG: aminodeoxychorismate/anthranilate synthase component II [SAR324 cluster bacterium]|nr:aminodeoxychorismate/anthranilate synthase component II [SAR324 cluster bacterium]